MFRRYREDPRPDTATSERRRTGRAGAAYPIMIMDGRGDVMARGRATDISQHGLHAVVMAQSACSQGKRVVIEVNIPNTRPRKKGRGKGRNVRYLAEIARKEQLGQMLGLGLRFIEKLT